MTIHNQQEWFAAVCAGEGVPATMWEIAVMNFWATQEYPDKDSNGNSDLWDAGFNAFATTWDSTDVQKNLLFDVGYGPGNWNNIKTASGGLIHVGVYATPEDGLKATLYTLNLSYYANIRRCLKDQRGYPEAVDDFVSWVGSRAYGQAVVDFMNACTASKTDLYVPTAAAVPAAPAVTKAQVFAWNDEYLGITFPLYWEALWKGGFTNYKNPVRPWSGDLTNDSDTTLAALRDLLSEHLAVKP